MSPGPGDPLVLRAARAFAGVGGDAEPADPPLRWGLDGARVRRTLENAARALRRALDSRAAGILERALAKFAERPVPAVAFLVAAVPVFRLLSSGATGEPLAVLPLALAGLVALVTMAGALHRDRERRIVLLALLGGLLLRVALGAAVHLGGGFPDEHHTYHPLAADAAVCWQVGGPSLLATHPVVENRAAYFYLLSGAYYLAGAQVVVGRVLGGLLGLFAALLAGEVARPMGGRRAAALAVAVLALHPEHALWSTTLARDTLTTLLVLAALAVVLRRPGRLLRGRLLLAAVPLALLAVNSFLAAGALAAVLVAMTLAEAFVQARGAARWPAVAAASTLAVAALVLVGHRWGNLFTPELFTAVRSRTIGTDPDFLPGLRFEGMLDVVAFLPLGAAFVLFAPWPWTAVHLHRFAYGLFALAGAAVTLLGFAGLVVTARRRPAAALAPILFLGLLLGLLALLDGTSGIVVRHRLPLTGVLCAGAGVALAGLRGDPGRS